MHLVPCACPQEPLEAAPRTALLADLIEGECWDGFWSSQSDGYFVRCTRSGGEVEWFQVADEIVDETAESARALEARVLTIRPKTQARSRVTVVVARSPAGRRMLVGNARRTTR
jgi:hypothetical protein